MSRVMTVGDMRRAMAGVADDTEVYVYGGEMNTYTLVRDIIPDMRDVDYKRMAVVIFRDAYRAQKGEGFKQLPRGTRGDMDLQQRDEKMLNAMLPWWIRWLF
jgi:hypothetical protein